MRYTNPRLLYLLYFTHALLNSVLLNDLEWLSKIFNDKKRRAVSLRQLSFLLVWSLSGAKQPSYKHFPSVGALSHKFSIAPSDETADRTKKCRWCKNGTELLYHHAKYYGSRAGCRWKSVMFFLFVTLWNDKVCDSGNATKRCNFQNSYGVIA